MFSLAASKNGAMLQHAGRARDISDISTNLVSRLSAIAPCLRFVGKGGGTLSGLQPPSGLGPQPPAHNRATQMQGDACL
jgi:hypothetical protein